MPTALSVLTRDMANRSSGVVAATRHRFTAGEADDEILHEWARECLGRHVSHPRSVEVHLENGVVTLTGDVLAGEDQHACRALRRVRGIERVEARWTVHSDPTGVPGLQGERRPRGRRPELLQENWSPTTRFVAGSGGVALTALTSRLPGPLAWTLRGAGAVVTARAVTNKPLTRLTGIRAGRRAVDITDGIAVAAPPEQVWR
jgi:hypothetical protein